VTASTSSTAASALVSAPSSSLTNSIHEGRGTGFFIFVLILFFFFFGGESSPDSKQVVKKVFFENAFIFPLAGRRPALGLPEYIPSLTHRVDPAARD